MEKKELSELTDQELLMEAKKKKLSPVMNALLIGFMVGVVTYSVVVSTWGLTTLIPLFIIYKLVNNSKKEKELEQLIKERNLKV